MNNPNKRKVDKMIKYIIVTVAVSMLAIVLLWGISIELAVVGALCVWMVSPVVANFTNWKLE